MSTVLDALRKADENNAREGVGGYGDEPPSRRPRRRGPRWPWLLLGLVALVGAFAGGLELSGDDGASTAEVENVAESPEANVGPVHVASAPEAGSPAAPPARRETSEAPVKAPEPAVGAIAPREVRPPKVARPDASQAPQMSEKRRRVLDRVLVRREEREARRQGRFANREQSQELRDAIRAAATPEEREVLLDEFREIRRIARAERSAASSERRLDREEENLGIVEAEPAGAGTPPPTQVAAVARPRRAAVRGDAPAPVPPPAQPVAVPPPPQPIAQAAPVPADEGLRRPPSSAPQVRINILQWSNDPGRRFAYMSIDGNSAMTQVREGESYQGLTVTRIFPEQVEFAHQGSTFLLRAN